MIESLTGQGINARHACRVLGVSESGYYTWEDRPAPPRTLRRIWLAGEIADVHKASGGTYGEMRVTADLRYGRQIIVGHNAVGSSCASWGSKGFRPGDFPKGARVARVTSLDLVRREFRRDAPNQPWMTDISEHPTREGKVYCCVVLAAFSRLVVGWSVESTQTTVLGHQHARHGHQPPRPGRRPGDSFGPRGPIHLLGLQPESSRRRPSTIDGCRRQRL